jgi:hypothetical protein
VVSSLLQVVNLVVPLNPLMRARRRIRLTGEHCHIMLQVSRKKIAMFCNTVRYFSNRFKDSGRDKITRLCTYNSINTFRRNLLLFVASDIWKAYTELKCKFSVWLALKDMAKKNWPCNPACSLCYCQPETTSHLLTQCNYTETLWNITSDRYSLPNYVILISRGGPVE